jgi:hypothetical protein
MAALLSPAAVGQEAQGFGDYELMDFDAPVSRWDSATFRPLRFSGGAMIRLKPADPAEPAMEVRAETMDFEQDAQGEIASVRLTGDVYLSRGELEIEADRGNWQRTTNSFEFTGAPFTATLEGGQSIRGSRITYDTEDGTYTIEQGRGRNIPLQGGGGPSAALRRYLLSAGDVTDWAGLIETIQEQAMAGAPSPGNHIASMMDEDTRAIFLGLPRDPAPAIQEQLVAQVNQLLVRPGFYSATAYDDVDLGPRAEALMARDDLSEEELVLRNRLLLEAAYPESISSLDEAKGEGE